MSEGGSRASFDTLVSFCPFVDPVRSGSALPCFLCSCFPRSHPRQSVAASTLCVFRVPCVNRPKESKLDIYPAKRAKTFPQLRNAHARTCPLQKSIL